MVEFLPSHVRQIATRSCSAADASRRLSGKRRDYSCKQEALAVGSVSSGTNRSGLNYVFCAFLSFHQREGVMECPSLGAIVLSAFHSVSLVWGTLFCRPVIASQQSECDQGSAMAILPRPHRKYARQTGHEAIVRNLTSNKSTVKSFFFNWSSILVQIRSEADYSSLRAVMASWTTSVVTLAG